MSFRAIKEILIHLAAVDNNNSVVARSTVSML
jgi:hypothetical protein